MIDLMHNLILRSMIDLKKILEKHMKFLPSQELIETAELTQILEEPRPENEPQVETYFWWCRS